MSIGDRHFPSDRAARLREAETALAQAQAAQAADQPLLRRADEVTSELRSERVANGWAFRVQEAFRARRGETA